MIDSCGRNVDVMFHRDSPIKVNCYRPEAFCNIYKVECCEFSELEVVKCRVTTDKQICSDATGFTADIKKASWINP
jgi:hypothetical protein